MSIVGEVTGVLSLLGKSWPWLRDRLDPARAQAQRLIRVYEAYGIARQQIPRLLPAELELPNAAFSSPDKLKDKLTPGLLDWAAEHLAINRSWLDGVVSQAHLIEDHYKAPAAYRPWLVHRLDVVPDATRHLKVWKPQGEEIGSGGDGPICLVYEEISEGLDGTEFSRYWLLSNQWSLHHTPCIENLVAAVAVARSLSILVVGANVPLNGLRQLESGKALIPEIERLQRGHWHPGDLMDPLPGRDSAWRRAIWRGAQAYLGKDVAAGATDAVPALRAADRRNSRP